MEFPTDHPRTGEFENLDECDKDSHTARIFQALFEHRYSRNRSQSPSLAGAESSIKAFPEERNGFLGQTAHDVLVANLVHKISSASPLLNTKLNELKMPPQPVEAESPLPSDIPSSQIAPSQTALQFAKKAASILDEFVRYGDQIHKTLTWTGGCRSWYKANQVNGQVTATFAGSAISHNQLVSEIRPEDFEIRYRSKNRWRFLGIGFREYELTEGNDLSFYVEH